MPSAGKNGTIPDEFGVSQDQVTWMENAGLSDYTDVAMMASVEAEVLKEIIAHMEADTMASAKLFHSVPPNLRRRGSHPCGIARATVLIVGQVPPDLRRRSSHPCGIARSTLRGL